MVVALTLLVFGLTQLPVIELLPRYAAAYLLVGACIFAPVDKLPSFTVFLLPAIPLIRLAYPFYRARRLQAPAEVLLAVAAVVVAVLLPLRNAVVQLALDARQRRRQGRADDRLLGPGTPPVRSHSSTRQLRTP
ncbi:hypothetical protein [Pseudarthrobacter sp. NS4]|uniref:hypothetical protein n=1 Tax=Pseudarthrobacter sp. NS4 TaxID=2973976 RepID=UPI002163B196|nr:hypothetical protein [Pseudarthrobacter sp. NS4]